MAKETSFEDILNQPMEEIDKPKPLPAGSYVCAVQVPPKLDKSTQKGTPYAEFTLKPLKPGEDVDTDELKEQGGIGTRTLRVTFYLTDGAKWRARQFVEDCGIEIEDKTLSEGFAELGGCQVIAVVKHQPSSDGSQLYANVDRTLPV
jgi:hypothetical protein